MAVEPLFRIALRTARKKMGWNQDNLAREIGLSRSAVQLYEGGTQPPAHRLEKIFEAFPEPHKTNLKKAAAANWSSPPDSPNEAESEEEDMILQCISVRRSRTVDLAGEWDALWLTTTDGKENRNREVVTVKKRLEGSWQFSNNQVSEDNPDGGFLWVARMELFDNKHLLGYYCARETRVLAKGTLCLELQANGREILGTWDGLSFDTMWAHGLVVLCRTGERASDLTKTLERFKTSLPKMPYSKGDRND